MVQVRSILEKRRDALVALTERLIEVESVESEELQRIIDDNTIGPLVVPGTQPAPGSLEEPKKNLPGHNEDEERTAQ